MTSIADERPPTPEDRRPSTPEDRPPSTAPTRAGSLRRRARAATRLLQRTAWAAVLVGAVTTACTSWGSAPWYAGWVGAAGAAALAALASPVRLALGESPRSGSVAALFHGAMLALMLCVLAGCFAFSLSGWFHAHDRDLHATLRVSATVTGCHSSGDTSTECTYLWAADGHEYRAEEGSDDQWPDGHRVDVRVDPVHPQRAPVTAGGYWPLWFGVVLGGLGTPFSLCVWWVLEESAND
ncbi:DUF3592 domain-containing protein [Kitasatospora sp. NPDC086801]|uniref:DUF3592 domain-containing protein n=1 Tax=Kitasatospora sp. NPDC086801 TaxID=3364066 RepID=UPI003815E17D